MNTNKTPQPVKKQSPKNVKKTATPKPDNKQLGKGINLMVGCGNTKPLNK